MHIYSQFDVNTLTHHADHPSISPASNLSLSSATTASYKLVPQTHLHFLFSFFSSFTFNGLEEIASVHLLGCKQEYIFFPSFFSSAASREVKLGHHILRVTLGESECAGRAREERRRGERNEWGEGREVGGNGEGVLS